jgi:uncharacterized protein YcbK (DUF882 family)
MQPDFLAKLDELRAAFGGPLIVSSGYRCPDRNAAVSTTGRAGPHTTGRAVDFLISGELAAEFVSLAMARASFWGLGIMQHGPHAYRFVHLDDLPNSPNSPRPRIWSYPK